MRSEEIVWHLGPHPTLNTTCVLFRQVTGTTVFMGMLMVGSMVTTITIALIESWQYTLGYLPLVPIAAALGTIKLRRAHESSKIEHSSFEEAGKVRGYMLELSLYLRLR